MHSLRKNHRFTICRTLVVYEPGGTDKSVPYAKIIVLRFVEPWWFMNLSERINPFPTHTLEDIPFNEPCKFHFTERL